MNFHEFFESVKAREFKTEGAEGHIQWKGTDVCIDVWCACGHSIHIDGYFLYHYECPACHKKYALGSSVKLIELTKEEADFVDNSGECCEFVQPKIDDEVIRI